MTNGPRITFWGGAGEVTGSNFLIETNPSAGGGRRILVDCGLFQAGSVFDSRNRDKFPYDPSSIDYLFVTHAHLDHIGRIPKLTRDGFRGVIYSTPPTREIASLMLANSLSLAQTGRPWAEKLPELFSQGDLNQSFNLWQTKPYYDEFKLDDFSVIFRDAGHTLGSAILEFKIAGKKLVFTGDLGNSPAPLLRDTDPVNNAQFLVVESVYGDRRHQDVGERKKVLEEAIESTASRGGTLIIPTFSFERTQELIYEIGDLMESSRIPLLPIILDSPLAIKITEIYKKYQDYLKPETRVSGKFLEFPQLFMTGSGEESRLITKRFGNVPKVIIAGSGMSVGGRVISHEEEYLPDAKNTLLLVGYQSPGTLGRRLVDGAKRVKISGREVEVKATVRSIDGYSGHRDAEGLLDFVAGSTDSLKKVFVVMGEPKASLFLVQ